MSDFSDLTVGLSGLEAQQTAMDTVGQNVANANTPGYVDEEVQLGSVGSVQHMGFDDSSLGAWRTRCLVIPMPAT